jgi:hypothetical protein
MEVDVAFVEEHMTEWLRHWDREVRGRGRAEGY